jgi:hypothetical protein
LFGGAYVGLLHRVLDDPRCAAIPLLRDVSAGFQLHHSEPLSTTRDKGLIALFDDTVRVQWACGVAAFVNWKCFRLHPTIGDALLMKIAVCAYLCQTSHYLAHCGRTGTLVSFLQRAGFLLSPGHHKKHHQSPYAVHFDILHGHGDLLLDVVLPKFNFEVALISWLLLTGFDVALFSIALR